MRPSPNFAPKVLFGAGFLAMALALSACGHADSANEAASADNVEIPAEEAMSGLPPAAVPVADSADGAAADSAVSGQ